MKEHIKTEAQRRKGIPVTSGVLFYFPDAIREVAKCSQVGNDQHNPNQHLHWAKEKSTDEYDCMVRHLLDHQENPLDTDGQLHLAKVAWRALAGLQRYMDKIKVDIG
jgi:hypothetical protein